MLIQQVAQHAEVKQDDGFVHSVVCVPIDRQRPFVAGTGLVIFMPSFMDKPQPDQCRRITSRLFLL